MIRGKIISEPNLLFIRPTTCVNGDTDYLIEGQKFTIELEVVAKEATKKGPLALLDFESLSTDQSIMGVFKINTFTASGDAALRKPKPVPPTPEESLLSITGAEFAQWAKAGNLPINERFNRMSKYVSFLDAYPNMEPTPTPIRFYKFITEYAKFHGYEHEDIKIGRQKRSLIHSKRKGK